MVMHKMDEVNTASVTFTVFVKAAVFLENQGVRPMQRCGLFTGK